jgi:LysM repeat protein
MLILTEHARARIDSTSTSSYSRPQNVVVSSPQNGNSAVARTDGVQLTSNAQQTKPPNPFEGTAPDYIKVKVGKWGSGNNDSLLGILNSQKYSNRELYKKNGDGVSLLDQVSQANNLKNPNLIREGQELLIPVKARTEATNGNPTPAPRVEPEPQATTADTTPTAQTPATTERANEPQVNEVTVGKWGRDKNGSLYGILNGQGFSRQQILKQDANGDSLLKQVARANGLADPNKIQEGASLKVPNSMEALAQMNVPELANRQAETSRPPVAEIRRIEPRPIELPEPRPIELPELRRTETNPAPVATTTQTEVDTPANNGPTNERVTANMGLLLDGVKAGKFKKDEFQYLNALSNRYEETRAQFSKEGYSNEELKTLGAFETNYGVTYTRLYNSDDVQLTNGTPSTSNPNAQLRVRHYEEGGVLWEGYKNGTLDSEAAIETMIRQRAEARAQGER